MIPQKVKSKIETLLKITENGELSWGYNEQNSKVWVSYEDLQWEISYHFNENYEEGQFNLTITKDGQDHYFSARESEVGYDCVKDLYDSAQASDL